MTPADKRWLAIHNLERVLADLQDAGVTYDEVPWFVQAEAWTQQTLAEHPVAARELTWIQDPLAPELGALWVIQNNGGMRPFEEDDKAPGEALLFEFQPSTAHAKQLGVRLTRRRQ